MNLLEYYIEERIYHVMKYLVIMATIMQSIELLFILYICVRHYYFDDDAVIIGGLQLLPSIFFEIVFIMLWSYL